jgi:hypothetical protein
MLPASARLASPAMDADASSAAAQWQTKEAAKAKDKGE